MLNWSLSGAMPAPGSDECWTRAPLTRCDLIAWSQSPGVALFLFGPLMSLALGSLIDSVADGLGNGPSEDDRGDYPSKPGHASGDHEILLPAVAGVP